MLKLPSARLLLILSLVLSLGLSLGLLLVQMASTPQTLLLTRHAEKLDESDDPPLSSVGQDRAERLSQLLSSAHISTVFVSERQRTQQTAQPLAQKLSIRPLIIPANERAQLLLRLKALPKRDVVLVVGHSNTLPSILSDLGVPSAALPSQVEYGDLFILTHKAGTTPSLLRLHY